VSDEVLPALIAGVFGALIGSFLNVCILRWGAEPKQSVLHPRRSHCPKCGYDIRWYDNVPVLSWLLLRGRCRGCGQPISVMYPAIELATAALWGGSVLLLGPTLDALELAVAATLLLAIAVSDARAYVIPHEFSIGGALIALGFAAWPDLSGLPGALQGAAFGAGLILLVGELSELALGQEAMGGGDCALMGMVGAFFGWEAVLPVVMLGALVSLVLHLGASLLRPRSARSAPGAAVAAERAVEEQGAGLRWGMVLKLLGGGLVPLSLVVLATRAGLLEEVVRAAFHGVLGAGIAYYLALVLPRAALGERWWRVAGLLGAAVGVALGSGVVPGRVVAGTLVAGAAMLWAGRSEVAASPETSEELSSAGYIPFGVGLAIAAGVVAFVGGPLRVWEALAVIATSLGAA
jgi:leader peptidase (prepilin peptidase)/N-methyltransferase